MNIFRLSLDLDKTPDVPDWVTLRQGDKSGTVIIATIYDHGTQLVGTYNARVVIGNPDGEHYYRANATYNAGVATATVNEQTAASVAGTTVGYFEILQGSTVIASTANFGVRILPSALDGAEPGEVYDSAIQEAIDGLNTAVAELPDTVEGILEDHPEWTTTVQDGSISVPKLASDVRSSLSGAILAAIGGTLVTAHDAAAVPPNSASIFGRSAQSGTPTPSSPKAITSVTAAELALRGANLLDNATAFAASSYYTVNADGTLTVTAEDSRGWTSVPIAPLGLGTFTLSIDGNAGGRVSINVVDGSSEVARAVLGNGSDTFALSIGGGVRIKVHQGTFPRTVRIQINAGSTATPYKPYDPSSSTLTIDLQGHELRSLPDGTRDEVTVDAYGHAVLTQRVGSYTVTGSETNISEAAQLANGIYRIRLNGVLVPAAPGNTARMLCTHAPGLVAWASATIHTYVSVNSLYLYATASSTADALAAYAGAKVIYVLAEPQTIDLGYVTLPTLPAPDLTAWAAQGAELMLTYQRDATMAIAGIYAQLAPVDGPTATSNHGVGTYLMLGGTLCKVTTAIAAGETIAIGTNVVATTVMTEILALTA